MLPENISHKIDSDSFHSVSVPVVDRPIDLDCSRWLSLVLAPVNSLTDRLPLVPFDQASLSGTLSYQRVVNSKYYLNWNSASATGSPADRYYCRSDIDHFHNSSFVHSLPEVFCSKKGCSKGCVRRLWQTMRHCDSDN